MLWNSYLNTSEDCDFTASNQFENTNNTYLKPELKREQNNGLKFETFPLRNGAAVQRGSLMSPFAQMTTNFKWKHK